MANEDIGEKFMQSMEEDIKSVYFNSPTPKDAEQLATKLLYTQIEIGQRLRAAELDFRMKRAGLKTIRSAVYLEECRKSDKKPTETMLECLINTSPLVTDAQSSLDYAEALKNELDNLLNVARESHIFLRALSKGRYE